MAVVSALLQQHNVQLIVIESRVTSANHGWEYILKEAAALNQASLLHAATCVARSQSSNGQDRSYN